MMCKKLQINRNTYYKYKDGVEDKDKEDFEKIYEVFKEGKETYGVKRIKIGLKKKYGIIMNHKKIRRIMRKYNLQPKYIKVYKPKTRQEVMKENIQPNLLRGDFETEKANQKWVTDITYLILDGERKYLCTIMDLYERKIVAYNIGEKMDLILVTKTLQSAISNVNGDTNNLIIHSDQGSQYTSYSYKQICADNHIQISMSRPGKPSDNAVMESFHSILKRETLYSNCYYNIDQYVNDVIDWIDFYSTKRVAL